MYCRGVGHGLQCRKASGSCAEKGDGCVSVVSVVHYRYVKNVFASERFGKEAFRTDANRKTGPLQYAGLLCGGLLPGRGRLHAFLRQTVGRLCQRKPFHRKGRTVWEGPGGS